MTTNLLVHNVLFLSGGILNIILAVSIIYLRRKKIDSLIVTFVLMTLSVATFQISQVLGVMAPDADTSRSIFMWNLCVIFIQIFMTHWFLIATDNMKKHLWGLVAVYASGLILFFIHLFYPESYLLSSIPKMYLPFYYVAGPLQWLTRAWFHVVGAYYFWVLFMAYRRSIDPIQKSRFLFLLAAVMYGFFVGETAVLLVYDIRFDPMWSSFFGLYTFLMAYTILRYRLLDFKLIIQKASIYAFATIFLIGFIIFANAGTIYFQKVIPGFPFWIMPTISAILAVLIGIFIWRKLRENDLIKYEFVTVIAHKFRTPLTQIRWATEEIASREKNKENLADLEYIKQASDRLVNLTGTLIEMSDDPSAKEASYQFKVISLVDCLRTLTSSLGGTFAKKNIKFNLELPLSNVFVLGDNDRLSFVFQTLLENAITYTPSGGAIVVSLARTRGKAVISVSDNGIGIAKDELHRIFNRFYRTHDAQNADTEGFGVGLYLSKSVIERHDGKIDVYSEGAGKGTTFMVELPIAK